MAATRVSVADMQIDPGTWVPQSPRWVRLHGPEGEPRGFREKHEALTVWVLDGVMWHDAPPPPAHHEHFVQSYGVQGFTQYFRCPCGAYADNRYPYWMDDRNQRVAPTEPTPEYSDAVRRVKRQLTYIASLCVLALLYVWWAMGPGVALAVVAGAAASLLLAWVTSWPPLYVALSALRAPRTDRP